MSSITGISTAAPRLPAIVAAAATAGGTAQLQTTGSNSAVVVSPSSGAAASASQVSPAPRSMDPTAVEDALFRVSGADGQTTLYDHVDRTLEEAKFGTAISVRNQAELVDAAVGEATDAMSYASGLGIPIHDSVNPDAVRNGAAPGTITVSPFNFTSGGSIYSVTPGANGILVGTKDGSAWQGVPGKLPDGTEADTGAAAAMQVLTLLNARKTSSAETMFAAKSSLRFNVLT